MRPLLLAAVLALPTAARAESVPAEWRASVYKGPRFHRYCEPARAALRDILEMVRARKVRAYCDYRDGLSASWEALAPEKAGTAVAALLSRETRFPEAEAQWWSPAPVRANWQRAMYSIQSDHWHCQTLLEVWDGVEPELAVRNSFLNASCGGGASFFHLSFEYLEPETAP